ncbi:serine protease persephone-like isoform X2 [Contarinia nasturtii]|uniref:serine protease persephone-like isoform X2 n=1 Tax=Contarinia nasturtii TaxID=265458 RepID=UPI0012D478FC|nr:serine protease persephone-like isoform X2 [Contarinia nasturtii]
MNLGILLLLFLAFSTYAETQSANDSESESDETDLSGPWKSLTDIIGNGTVHDFENLIRNVANLTDNLKSQALFYASESDNDQITDALVKNGSDVNVKLSDGWRPIHWASWNGFDHVVDLLIKRGAECNIANNYGRTSLHLAAFNGHVSTAELLIQKGAQVNFNDCLGLSSLMFAASTGQVRMVELLLKNDADIYMKNTFNKTAQIIATERGYPGVVQLLKKARSSFKACERDSKVPVENVLNGESVQIEQFPWMAALGYLDEQYRVSFTCAGTIISENFVMTAAHCTSKDGKLPIVVRLGKVSLTDGDGSRPINHPIEEIILHPDYNEYTQRHDLALIRVGSRIKFSNKVAKACLHSDLHDESPDVKLLATGWGRFELNSVVQSNVLKKIPLKTVPLIECITNFLRNINVRVLIGGIGRGQYCAVHTEQNVSTCTGDSGGPLQMFLNGSNIPIVIGIVSFGVSCTHDTPSIYTRVAYYLDWIESFVWPRNGTVPIGNTIFLNKI